MNINDSKTYLKADIEAVITSYNQGSMILEAVQSVCNQTLLPKRIIIVDDGSTDKYSLDVLNSIKNNSGCRYPFIFLKMYGYRNRKIRIIFYTI